MKISSLLALAVCLGAATPAASQLTTDSLRAGSRVRVSVPTRNNGQVVQGTDRWVTGTLISINAAQLSMRVDGAADDGEYTVPIEVLDRLELSRGELARPDAQRKGMVQGAVVGGGFALGALLFGKMIETLNDDEDGEDGEESPSECPELCQVFGWSRGRVLRNGAIGVSVGGLLGLGFGVRTKERWERVYHPRLSMRARSASLAFQLPLGN